MSFGSACTEAWARWHGAERVVDVDVAELGELAREALVVLLFFRVEAKVLEQADLPGAEICTTFLAASPTQSSGRCTSTPEQLGETLRRTARARAFGLARLGAAEVRARG